MGTFDTLNRFPDIKGRPAVARGPDLRPLMVSSPDEPATAYGLIAEWVTYPADFSSATVQLRAERALPRRQAHHARGRHLLARGAQEGLPQLRALLQERDGGREDRRSRGHVPLRRQGQPRAADDHRRAAGPAQALLAGHGGQRRAARPRQVDARDPPGLGPLPHQGDRCRPQHHLRARQGLVGEGPAGLQGPMELRRDQVRLLPRTRCRPSRPSRPGSSTTGARTAPRTGRPASTSTRSSAGWSSGTRCRSSASRPCRRSPSTSGARNSRTRACGSAFNLAFDFEWANKNLFYDQYVRVDSYFDNSELKATGLPQGRELEILKEVKDQVPPEVFTTRVARTPSTPRPRTRARTCRRRPSCWPRPAGQAKDGVLTNAAGRAAHRRVPARAARLRAHRAALQEQRWRGSASRPACASSTPRSISAATTPSTSTSSSPASRSRCRPATSSATSGARRPPARKAAATSSASRTPPSTS